VEVCRQRKAVSIPEDLRTGYFSALAQLPALVAAAANREWDSEFLCCALSAIAAAKGSGRVAEAILELSPEVAQRFLRWFFEET